MLYNNYFKKKILTFRAAPVNSLDPQTPEEIKLFQLGEGDGFFLFFFLSYD